MLLPEPSGCYHGSDGLSFYRLLERRAQCKCVSHGKSLNGL